MRRRFITVAASCAAVLALTAGTCLAAALVEKPDQAQTNVDEVNWKNSGAVAQTFTPAYSGPLDKVSVDLIASAEPNVAKPAAEWNGMSISITTTDPGDHFPTSTVVATQDVVIGDGWQDIVFDTPGTVTAGTVYALVLTPSSGDSGVNWRGTCDSGSYAGGEALIQTEGWETVVHFGTSNEQPGTYCFLDYAFKTYVMVDPGTPKPPTTAMAAPDDSAPGIPANLLIALIAASSAASAAVVVVVNRRRSSQS